MSSFVDRADIPAPTGISTPSAESALYRVDSWQSELTGLGRLASDKRTTHTAKQPYYLTRDELDDLYEGDYLARRIVSKLPQMEIRSGYEIEHLDNEDLESATHELLKQLDFDRKLREARTWERLHGGAVMILGCADGLQDQAMPLNENGLRAVRWVEVLDRWQVQIEEWQTKPDKNHFGKPELFRLQARDSRSRDLPQLVHASRCIWFPGAHTTPRMRERLQGWGASVLQPMYDVLRDFGTSYEGASLLCQEIGYAVYKMKNLATSLAGGKKSAIADRLEMMAVASGIIKAKVLDADLEDFERKGINVQGLPQLLQIFQATVAAAADMPITVLFGRSPAGQNSTGESDMENWYGSIQESQEDNVAPPLEKFLRLLFLSKEGPSQAKLPERFTVKFKPLDVPSDSEIATTRSAQASVDQIYMNAGVLSPQEVRDSRFGSGEYSLQTNLDDTFSPEQIAQAIEQGQQPEQPIQSDPFGNPDTDETL